MPEMGKDGFIAFGTSSGGASTAPSAASNNLDSWSISPTVNLADITAFGNSGRAFLPTIREWKATASGTLDMDTGTTNAQYWLLQMAQTTGTSLPVYCRFKTSTGAYTGPGILTSFSIDSKVADKVGVTYSIQGTSYLQFN
jgi:hypothetical protein